MSPDDPFQDAVPGSAAFRERLTAYLDDRMAPDEARAFLASLEAHPAAWKEAESSRRVWSLLAAYRDEPVPEGFAERVLGACTGMARVGVEPVAERTPFSLLRGGRRARTIALAASILVAVGAGALVGRRFAPSGESPPPHAVASLDAVPVGLLDRLDSDTLVQLASLSDEEFDALLTADPSDLAASGG
jgi:anti-sigma factor RsiW